jgi:hypothetical protein
MATTAAAAAVVHFHAVLWVPYLAADVVVDAAAATGAGDGGAADRGGHRAVRGRLHTLVQVRIPPSLHPSHLLFASSNVPLNPVHYIYTTPRPITSRPFLTYVHRPSCCWSGQAAVCTLWRSRVAHEAHEAPAPPPAAPATPTTAPSPTGEDEEGEGEGEGGAAGGAVVRPSLTVVFADGHRLTVTQVQSRPRV